MRTNDRRYPSHDSRGIVNGSSIDVRSMGDSDFPPFRCQKLFFSVGEGWIYPYILVAMVILGTRY